MSFYATLAELLWVYMNLWFAISLIKKRNDVADVAWGLGFVLLAWTSFLLGGARPARGLLVSILVSVWGLRLAWHIESRHRGKAEDYRYLAWRREWGVWFYPRSYLQVYMLQGVLLFMVALPVMMINRSESGRFGAAAVLGLCVWLAGFICEATGDAELANFVKDPGNKGKIMQSGLWRYSRHPNYFGEIVQWWGIWIMALGSVGNIWVALAGPLTITLLIWKVSGVPMLEKRMSGNPAFADYKKRTSVLIPWFPGR